MRSIEEMQSSINNIREELQSLWHDLDDLRNEKNGGAFTFDIDELAVMAKHNPITPHPLRIKDKHTKRCYITLLLSVAQFEPEKLKESLSMAHAIAYGCGYIKEGNLLDEYTSSHMLTFTQIDEIVALFAHDDLRLMLVEEMLLMAGRFESGLKSAVEYISQICFLLKISADELTFLSQMSAVILSEDLDLYTCGIENKYDLFDCYLKKIDFSDYRVRYTVQKIGIVNSIIKDVEKFLSGNFDQNDPKIDHMKDLKEKLVSIAPSGPMYKRSFIDSLLPGHMIYQLLMEAGENPWRIAMTESSDEELYRYLLRYMYIAKKDSERFKEIGKFELYQNYIDRYNYDIDSHSVITNEYTLDFEEQRDLPVGVILHPLECKQSVDMEKVKKAYELHQGVL